MPIVDQTLCHKGVWPAQVPPRIDDYPDSQSTASSSSIYARDGVDLERALLASWVGACPGIAPGSWLRPKNTPLPSGVTLSSGNSTVQEGAETTLRLSTPRSSLN